MKKYTNQNPSFSEEIDIYEETDPVDAETVDNMPLKELQDNLLWLKKNGTDNLGLATKQEVIDLADELMEESGGGGGSDTEIATNEDIQEAIENLMDL